MHQEKLTGAKHTKLKKKISTYCFLSFLFVECYTNLILDEIFENAS